MKFSCSKELLDKQLNHVSRIITVRSTAPVLSNVLLETDKNIIRISSTDLDLAITTHLPAEIEQEGTFTVPAKLFQEFVHQNPDEIIQFTLESFELVCKSKKVTARISGIDADEFPSLPRVEGGQRLSLPLPLLVDAMKRVIIACAVDSSRPVLTGLYLHLEDDTATLAATDSFRLVEKKLTIVPLSDSYTLNIPSRTVQEIIRVASTMTSIKDVELEVSDQQIIFRIGSVELFSRVITGNFPKYTTIIPKNFVTVADITTSELVQALRLSTVFSQSGVSNVLLEITEGGDFTIATHGSQRGNTKHTIYALLQDGFTPLRLPFNARFLLDACSASGSSHLQLRFSGQTTPLVVATDDPNYTQLVMPIRLEA
jgi:DNA polymerase-3 subunit beta